MTKEVRLANPPYDARAIANLILDQADQLAVNVYVTTLLKVLYFAHGWHLARFGVPLVAQPFEAWQHGPVIRVVYDQISRSDRQKVASRLTTFDTQAMENRRAMADVAPESADLVRSVLKAYGTLHPYKLSDLTHEPGSPWVEVWQAASLGALPGAKLEDVDIRQYFLRQNEADVLGNA